MTELDIIIPTFNRADWLAELLASIAGQTLSPERFGVIIVDDGSTDATPEITGKSFPFNVRYIRQENQGDAEARNTGARDSRAEFLLFLDDDIILDARYAERILDVKQAYARALVVGNDQLWLQDDNPLTAGAAAPDLPAGAVAEIPFAEICSNNMIVARRDYFELGMMDSLGFSGSSMWCDVDFAYRAHGLGFATLRSLGAVCWHRDHVQRSLESMSRRMEEVAYRSAALFERYPELVRHLPMFDDMQPIRPGADGPGRVLRKILRGASATGPGMALMVWLHGALKGASARRHLRTWIVGANIYRGYRRGLRAR